MEKVVDIVEVCRTREGGKIAIKHQGLKADVNGVSRIVLSPRHARHFTIVLIMHAGEAEDEEARKRTDINEAGA